MKVLFMTLLDFESIEEHNIYTDLLREFRKNSHEVYVISPVERKKKQETRLIKGLSILKLKIGNIQKTNIIEKGISTLLLESTFISGIRKYFSDVKFDLILYSTPPITFCGAIEYVKKRDNAKTYLLLKDIFPQNAVDMGMLSKTGIRGIIYRFFRKKEKKLYALSDYIGCMSEANVNYVLTHNHEIDTEKIEICPNSIEVIDRSVTHEQRNEIRKKYDIPLDKKVFVYGGNLGKPQGVDFLIECLRNQKNNKQVFFVIIGSGTEFIKLESFVENDNPQNVRLMTALPKKDYDSMIGACDVGMIFLDHRFTIPNFPSRLLSYMQAKLPVLACTDTNTDIGKIMLEGEFGWWTESIDVEPVSEIIHSILNNDVTEFGRRSYEYLKKTYPVERSYKTIANRIGE